MYSWRNVWYRSTEYIFFFLRSGDEAISGSLNELWALIWENCKFVYNCVYLYFLVIFIMKFGFCYFPPIKKHHQSSVLLFHSQTDSFYSLSPFTLSTYFFGRFSSLTNTTGLWKGHLLKLAVYICLNFCLTHPQVTVVFVTFTLPMFSMWL